MLTLMVLLCVALIACAIVSFRMKKAQSSRVALLQIVFLAPIIGNILIIGSGTELWSYIGSYLYFIGLDWSIMALLVFTCNYCGIEYRRKPWYIAVWVLMVLDTLQLLANPITHHAFRLVPTVFENAPYYSLVPLVGQTIHRIVAYGVFFVSVGIFLYKTVTVSRIYKERYLVILLSMIFTGIWESYFIFSGMPVDVSMIALGVFALLVFYFSMLYKPFRLLDRMLARVVETLSEIVLFFDADGVCIYTNGNARRILGLTGDDDLAHAHEAAERVVGSVLPIGFEWEGKRHIEEGDYETFWRIETRHLIGSNGKIDGCVLSIRDITDEQVRLMRERHLATHDRLTGLYNKEHLYEQARKLIDANPSIRYIVGALDVKDFKIINDIYSKDYGDELLVELANRIRAQSKKGHVYGRISGDKFGFVMPAESFDVDQMEKLLEDNKYGSLGKRHPIVVHMGIYDVTEPDVLISVMFDRAFMAIASIKNDFQKHIALYDSSMREEAIWSQRISNQLEEAIRDGQIRPYLQPLVNANGKIVGAEILARWVHPEEGFLSPARFIPVFEKNGMIATLDSYMWECAAKILKNWQESGNNLFLSVNISPKDFYFIDVYQTIKEIVDRYQIDPRMLRLEITETVMMSDLENRLKIIDDLRAYGFIVEMDDFGSGYSSLNMLKDIPVDVLKIDMVFLYKTKDLKKAQTILQTIINLSGHLGIPAITEGVETADQVSMLVSMGCNLFQGYYFAKPMPLDEFEQQYRAA